MKCRVKLILAVMMLIFISAIAIADDPFAGMRTYDAGQYKVGLDMVEGQYMVWSTHSISGYFCVSSDANGNDILFNDNFETNSIIEVRNGEYVELNRCMAIALDDFYEEYTIKRSATGVMFRVGYDILPGEYKLIAEEGKTGYYCIYADLRHDDIISNDNFSNSSYVTVRDGEYLILNRCTIK